MVRNICAKSPVSHEVSKAPLSFISLRKETFWFDARARVFVPSIIRIFLSNCTLQDFVIFVRPVLSLMEFSYLKLKVEKG